MSIQRASKPVILRLDLPLPPSVNEQYATVNGRRISTLVARHFKEAVKKKIHELEQSGQLTPDIYKRLREGYLALLLLFYFETPLRRDLDGGLKITQDALCTALGLNDNRVVSVHLLKYIDPRRPRLEVELETLDDWQFDEEYVVLPQTRQ
ncbi:MAG TPA: RusA family crossover junction endodeoxyribonuclease [Ktedonobacteraceae bacterium]|nr:RusA family crossover junction endodeoxyribonuclease [Ktedonobacteraceae bacterium]